MNHLIDSGSFELLHSALLSDQDLAWTISRRNLDGSWALECSPAYTKLTGFCNDLPSTQPLGLHLAPDAPAEQEELLADALVADTVSSISIEARHADGTTLATRVVVASLRAASPPTWLALHQDLGKTSEDSQTITEPTPWQAQLRTEWLIEHLGRLGRARTISELCSIAVKDLVPTVGTWAGIVRYPEGRPSAAEYVAVSSEPATDNRVLNAISGDLAAKELRPVDGSKHVSVSITALDSMVWTVILAPDPSKPLNEADIEMLRFQLTRIGAMAEELLRNHRESRQIQTIDSVILAPRGSVPGLDIAAEMSPLLHDEMPSTWCDAFPTRYGSGLVVSHVYNSDAETLSWSATARSTLRALLLRSDDPYRTLEDFTTFAHKNFAKTPLSAGQLITLKPDGANHVLRMASAVYLPFVLRVPGQGFQILGRESNAPYLSNGLNIPAASMSITVPPGSVIAMLTPLLFDSSPVLMINGPEQLVEKWQTLPENAPAAAYADIALGHAEKQFSTARCILVARIAPDSDSS